jgi:hypothetical protein
MDPVTAFAVASALKLVIQGAFTLAEQAGMKPEEIDAIYLKTKEEYEAAKKALG